MGAFLANMSQALSERLVDMASIDELEALDRAVEQAERTALRNLAGHLRDEVLDLPSESKLARAFVRHALAFEMWANGSSPGLWGGRELEQLTKGVREANGQDVKACVADVLELASGMVDDYMADAFMRVAPMLRRDA